MDFKPGRFILVTFLLACLTLDASALDRRRDQFSKEPGHYILPIPYSLPGVGEGILIAGAYNNIADTQSDVIGFAIGGDLQGAGIISLDNHLVENHLILDVYLQKLTKATVRNYATRGMRSDELDYTLLELRDNEFYGMRLTGSWFERMFEIYGGALDGSTQLAAIRDRDGNLIQDTTGATVDSSTIFTAGLRFDWTDDYQDPRRGIRYQISRWWTEDDNPTCSEYYQIEHNLTGYIPMGRRSSWVWNFFKADAHVTRQGTTDFATVEAEQGLDCDNPALSAEQQSYCQQVVNNIIARNRYGTAEDLGGWNRLRSFPNGRYKGAHVQFIGTEFRWNLTEEFRPFNIYIAKDIRTTIQLAFFYERGTVADEIGELGDIWKDSYGIGARMVTASGLVFRADVADGDEGAEYSIIIGYPWESF